MGQVPTYTVIGRGRLATHFLEYLRLSGIAAEHWHRDQTTKELEQKLETSNVVLLAISDSAIKSFYDENREHFSHHRVFHCSGSLILDEVEGLHPLMTFGPTTYSLEFYQNIPFVTGSTVTTVPGLPNAVHHIDSKDMGRYHMLCVLGGNFSQLLWSKVIGDIERLGLPRDVVRDYALQSIENVFLTHESLTGPLIRGDRETIDKHRDILAGDPWLDVYNEFVRVYSQNTVGGNSS